VEIQRVLRGFEARRTPMNAQMGRGREFGSDPTYPGSVNNAYNEDAARGLYAYWLEMMRTPVRAQNQGQADAGE
jgi:hypothetical protein